MRLLAPILLALVGSVLTSCNGDGSREAAAPKPAEKAVQQLRGGDPRAWLVPRGNNADSGYCAARLKLPLAQQPKWEKSYTPASFMPEDVQLFMHYDGLIIAAGQSPQVLGLDASSGKEVFNADLFVRGEEVLQNEEFRQLLLDPQGLMLGSDNIGRRYCWDLARISDAGPARLWVTSAHTNTTAWAAISQDGLLFTGWERALRASASSTGIERYKVPAFKIADGSEGSIVAADNGIALVVSNFGDVQALRLGSGELLWSVEELCARPPSLPAAVISNTAGLVFLNGVDGLLECRELESGRLRWTYEGSGLYAAGELHQLAATGAGAAARPLIGSIAVLPDSLLLGLKGGHLARLSFNGDLLWSRRLDCSISALYGFEGSFLVQQSFGLPRGQAGIDEITKDSPVPPWPGLRARYAKMGLKLKPYDQAMAIVQPESAISVTDDTFTFFTRFLALRVGDGAELSAFEPEVGVRANICPAQGMVVLGGSMKLEDRLQGRKRNRDERVIQAFEWIEQP